jgi:hypothetical protein
MTKINIWRHFDMIAVEMLTQRHGDRSGVPGGLGFLHPEDIRSCPKLAATQRLLPRPRPLFLEHERPSSMEGVLVLQSAELDAFERALDRVLDCEMNAQAALELREHYDVPSHRQAWQVYLDLLSKVHDTISSTAYGTNFPASFWLFHSK